MLILKSKRQADLWENMLPKELFELNDELKTIDSLLDDERFLLPFLKKHRAEKKANTGRNTTPISIYFCG
jgi:IS5 family transposase